jgi:hypothetical protein
MTGPGVLALRHPFNPHARILLVVSLANAHRLDEGLALLTDPELNTMYRDRGRFIDHLPPGSSRFVAPGIARV